MVPKVMPPSPRQRRQHGGVHFDQQRLNCPFKTIRGTRRESGAVTGDTGSQKEERVLALRKGSAAESDGPAGGPNPRLPAWLLIGAPKAGTTAFAGWLGQHPEAFLSQEKELYFFDDHWSRGTAWYASQFGAAPDGVLCGEATPSYFYSDLAMRRIAETLPDPRLLVILREPAKRAWSQYLYVRQLGEELRDFRQAIEDELSDPSHLPWPHRVPGYVSGGCYAERVRIVREMCGPDSLLVLFHEELVADPIATYAAACAHIGLDPSFVPELRRENPTYDIRSVHVQRALWALWRQTPTRNVARRLARLNRKPGAYSPLPPDMRSRLRRRYQEDAVALEEMIGRRLPPAWYEDAD